MLISHVMSPFLQIRKHTSGFSSLYPVYCGNYLGITDLEWHTWSMQLIKSIKHSSGHRVHWHSCELTTIHPPTLYNNSYHSSTHPQPIVNLIWSEVSTHIVCHVRHPSPCPCEFQWIPIRQTRPPVSFYLFIKAAHNTYYLLLWHILSEYQSVKNKICSFASFLRPSKETRRMTMVTNKRQPIFYHLIWFTSTVPLLFSRFFIMPCRPFSLYSSPVTCPKHPSIQFTLYNDPLLSLFNATPSIYSFLLLRPLSSPLIIIVVPVFFLSLLLLLHRHGN